MTLVDNEIARFIQKFNEGNTNIWNFKIEMLLAFMYFWDIEHGSKEAPPSNAYSKM